MPASHLCPMSREKKKNFHHPPFTINFPTDLSTAGVLRRPTASYFSHSSSQFFFFLLFVMKTFGFHGMDQDEKKREHFFFKDPSPFLGNGCLGSIFFSLYLSKLFFCRLKYLLKLFGILNSLIFSYCQNCWFSTQFISSNWIKLVGKMKMFSRRNCFLVIHSPYLHMVALSEGFTIKNFSFFFFFVFCFPLLCHDGE